MFLANSANVPQNLAPLPTCSSLKGREIAFNLSPVKRELVLRRAKFALNRREKEEKRVAAHGLQAHWSRVGYNTTHHLDYPPTL